ncbi:rRNA biogenesis protein rrp36-like [Anoplophora glabripennis]|uniref:rRNA biogenesis protein rrp36-like n=1 Tax=Anoplophora glabripennis TaxID=217634 RepID=UPI0008755151|nr:rRNA biogenesis protein rrp36-like [Anoplophora glabripennis]
MKKNKSSTNDGNASQEPEISNDEIDKNDYCDHDDEDDDDDDDDDDDEAESDDCADLNTNETYEDSSD